ncbi:MAG TPA: DnaJ C-terminal domain-containing protein, partial [Bacteroidales bacterium]|nr:DnaJ C-terminal domain-containing protein [Bacteroidales bacterium]
HPKVKREGNDLFLTAWIGLYTAVLGGEAVIETFDGHVKIKIKPGTQSGARIKLKGKGFPVYKKEQEFGDMIVTLMVRVPENLTPREKELFKELSKMQPHGT